MRKISFEIFRKGFSQQFSIFFSLSKHEDYHCFFHDWRLDSSISRRTFYSEEQEMNALLCGKF